eukprot:CAMPEP_0197670690 /NCGR_PEP_ID=MMETSP1338-20131121/75077_1 /TAXON_ID=43686 ORGANISM="Pelagodinium beii, Strain RCC1491" /NCGR_SAMPLE_ID=MMETSP1338 /ASSEMBLY_ACC=CAM_ASM_000754 /LENGTH=377 /DNA_ID=CAMNT_0043250459 /DNA_START=46 /DNA_END=1179 /DNA_ORIENTATION=+
MGYNEPDQYGPACAGESTAGIFGCGPQDYKPASSAGFAALFDPAKAALEWQKTITALASAQELTSGSVRKIAGPAMAQAAAPIDDCSADPARKETIKYCKGWLQVFKNKTLSLRCTNLHGSTTNCWDVLDAIPIHAYGRSAAEIKQKIQTYHKVFLEDFMGENGRKRKVLWLTEVTMGSNDGSEITHFVDELMDKQNGLLNRQLFSYVERISWFSEWSMGAFTMGDYVPKKYEAWSSSLFEPTTGHPTPHGQRFLELCGGSSSPSSTPAASLPAPERVTTTTSLPAKLPRAAKAPAAKSVRCSVGDTVDCPDGKESCAGNQCCSDGSTCPSADASFKECADAKSDDCTKAALEQEERLVLLAATGHRLFSEIGNIDL